MGETVGVFSGCVRGEKISELLEEFVVSFVICGKYCCCDLIKQVEIDDTCRSNLVKKSYNTVKNFKGHLGDLGIDKKVM